MLPWMDGNLFANLDPTEAKATAQIAKNTLNYSFRRL